MKKFFTLLSLLLLSLGAMQMNAQLLDRSGWTVTTSSEGDETSTSGHAATIIDGDISTYWHSYWSGMSNPGGYLTPMLPQFFTIDLGSTQTFKTIGYVPRSDKGNGTATSWKLYVSDEPFASTSATTSPSTIVDSLGEPAMSGTWSYDDFDPSSQIQTATASEALSGRYVMFVITGATGDNYGSCAEFFLSQSDEMSYPTLTYGSNFDEDKAISLSSTAATSLKTDQWYAIKNVNKGYWQDQQSGAWKTVSGASIDGERANAAAGYLFKLKDAGDGKYNIISGNGISVKLTLDGWGSSSADLMLPFHTFTIANIGDATDHFYIQQTDNSAIADGNGNVVGWGTTPPTQTGGNNDHQFFEVTLVDAVDYHITPANNKVYTIATSTRGNWAYDPNYSYKVDSVTTVVYGPDNLVSTGRSDVSITADNQKHFAILTSSSNKTYIYSVAAGKFVSANGSGAPLTVAPKTGGTQLYDNASNSENYPYVVIIDGKQIAISNGYEKLGGIISSWNDLTDPGNQVRIAEVENETFDAAIPLARIALFEALSTTYNLGTAYGQYTDTEGAYAAARTAAQTALEKADATADDLNNALTALNNAAAKLTFNTPADGAFIRIKSHNSTSAYLAGENSTDQTARSAYSTATDGTTIFYYSGGSLLNYGSALYLCNNSNHAGYNGVQTAGTAVAFSKNANVTADGAGAYYVTFKGNSGATRYLYARDENYADAGSGAPNNIHYTFDLEAVDSLPVAISAAGYATLYAPVALTIPEGVTAYTVTMEASSAKLNALEGTIPANTGVVLAGNEGTYRFAITSSTATAETALTGSVPSVNKSVGTYILANKNNTVGFYAINNENDVTVHGFRAFYENSDSNVAAYLFGGDDKTGISLIESLNGANGAALYDLSGRRVAKAAKGIYIQNGKKVLVK